MTAIGCVLEMENPGSWKTQVQILVGCFALEVGPSGTQKQGRLQLIVLLCFAPLVEVSYLQETPFFM